MKKKIVGSYNFIKKVVDKFSDDQVPRLGAALSFYTVFSITPLLIISIYLVGFLYDPTDVSNEIFIQVEEMVGKDASDLIKTTVQNASLSETGPVATIISLITLIIGATAVFIQLQESLNIILRVRQKKGRGIKGIIKDRVMSFIMIIGSGVVIVIFLIITSLVAILTNYVGSLHALILEVINFLITFVIIFVLFTLIYKILPDVHLSWKDARAGAFFTTIFFVLGKILVGIYLGKTSFGSIYGAAGSLAILLIWIYYSSQVVFLGAELTYFYATRYGKKIIPDADGELID